MPFLDFLFGGGDDSTSVKVPKWLNQAGKGAVNLGQQLATRPYTPYSFQRIANFSDDQKDAMGMLRRGANQVSMRADPLSRMKKFNPLENPKNIDTVRLIDRIPGGKGGGVNDYMNPYHQSGARPDGQAHPGRRRLSAHLAVECRGEHGRRIR
jgi:hypothetical protein